jgi:hypothetical protein
VQGSRQGAPAARILTLAIWLSLAACARSDPVPTVASGPLPAASARPVTEDLLANDAVDRDDLLSLLDDAGFEGATELVGADRAAGIHQASVRAVAFADGDGADRYLGWLDEHVDEVIGVASPVGEVALPGADASIEVFRHEPGDCCPKATVSYLTAWREGDVVVVLQLAGPSVEPSDVSAAAERVELGP